MEYVSNIAERMRGFLLTAAEAGQRVNSAGVSSGEDVTRAMRGGMTAENASKMTAGGDTVTISEEGRALAAVKEEEKGPGRNSTPGAKNSIQTGLRRGGETENADAAQRAREQIVKQIKEVRKKIEEAKQRLAQVTAVSGGADGILTALSGGEEDLAAETEAMAKGMTGQMDAASEAEAIQSKIDMLGQQLQTLYQQLRELAERSGGTGMGTAGIGGSGESGGKGERIFVS